MGWEEALGVEEEEEEVTRREGGRRRVPERMTTYFPNSTLVTDPAFLLCGPAPAPCPAAPCPAAPAPAAVDVFVLEEVGAERARSPRIQT